MLPERPYSYNVMQIRYCDNFWRRENYSNEYEAFLTLNLLLKNATKHNSIKISAARLHISSNKFWNCLKDHICKNVKKLFVGEQADFMLD